MAVTLRDIAQRVGKSVTTVSRALNDYDDVGPETKALVREIADELGYIPSAVAQRLQKRRSDTLGLILPTFGPRFSDPYFSELLAGIGNQASQHGYDLLVSTHAPGDDEINAYKRSIQGQRVDGLLIVRTRRQDARIEMLRAANFPFVAFGRTENPMDFPYVDEDGIHGMVLIAKHLVDLGHIHIGCITPPADLMFTHYRLKGISEGLAEAGLSLNSKYVYEGDLTQRGGYQAAQKILAAVPRPTAIVACNDLMGMGAISAAQEQGLLVGKDISITGFDNIPMAEHYHPSLTTVHQPIYQIGSLICQMLIQQLQGEMLTQRQVLLKPELIIRQSSGPIP